MTEQQRAWVPREERRVSPTPTEIPPHSDEGGLPPCEAGIADEKPCPRPATVHYGYMHLCGEHMEWTRAGEDEDEAALSVYHARRFLWKAQVEGLESLEERLERALVELEDHRKGMELRADEAARKADVVEAGEER